VTPDDAQRDPQGMAADIVLCECAARDGLQHEPEFVATADKIRMIDAFSAMGFKRIEATSFSHPKYVPQFADAEEVLKGIARPEGVSFKASCVNLRAVERAVQAKVEGYGPDEISLIASASEAHQLRNTGRSHAQVRKEYQAASEVALQAGLKVGGTIGTAFGCPFIGEVTTDQVAEWVQFFVDHGTTFINLGDTTGLGQPWLVRNRITELAGRFPEVTWSAHFHDTRGSAIANCVAAVQSGVRYLDSAFGGIGGHPAKIKYNEGHTGNVATEDLASLLDAAGFELGLEIANVIPTALLIEETLGRELHGRVARSGLYDARLEFQAPPAKSAPAATVWKG
jgi:hydroxymethylglutaryl-CoA lyase